MADALSQMSEEDCTQLMVLLVPCYEILEDIRKEAATRDDLIQLHKSNM